MIFEAGRDTVAIFALDQLLSQAREEYIEQELSGQVPDQNFWPTREAAAIEEIKRRFYNPKVRQTVKPPETEVLETGNESSEPGNEPAGQADSEADQADFDQHGQKLTEQAIWMTHEIIKQIPFVGNDLNRGD